jgi:hypothetical protein
VTKEPIDNIYSTPKAHGVKIPAYKRTRLVFSNGRSFWTIWHTAAFEDRTRIQLVYKLTTAMSLSRFSKPEMRQMLIGWHKKHEYKIDYVGIDFIIDAVDKFTLPARRIRSQIDKSHYRARRKLKGTLDPAEKEKDRVKKQAENARYRAKKKLQTVAAPEVVDGV